MKEFRLRGDLPTGEERYFTANDVAFGTDGSKTVRTLLIKGRGECGLVFGNGRETKTFSVRFVNGRALLGVRLKGEKFSLTIKPSADCEVYSLEGEIVTLDGGSAGK